MHDGSRHFGALPQTHLWHDVRDHVAKLPGSVITEFVCDAITETWIQFSYRQHEFSINDQFGDYWFFVTDSGCPEEILLQVLEHFERVLRHSRK